MNGRVPLRQFGSEHMTDLSYSVGRLMFAVLHQTLGDEAFDRALRLHYQKHKASGTSTSDLVQAFVDVGGPVAQRVFDDWLDSTVWVRRLRVNAWPVVRRGGTMRPYGGITPRYRRPRCPSAR